MGMLLVNTATLVWASNMVLGRALRGQVGPITLAGLRFGVATLVFYLLVRRTQPQELRLGREAPWLLGMALTGVVLFVPILYWGLRYTTAANATLIAALAPFVTGLWATWLLREPMTRPQATAAALAFLGVAWLISGGRWQTLRALQLNPGDLLILLAVALWGLYSVLGRRVMRTRSSLGATAWSAFLALPLLALGALWETRQFPVTWSPTLLLAVLYLGIFPSVVGFWAWNTGVQRLSPSGAMVFYNTLPLYGALLSALFLGERLTQAHLIGGALIVSAGLWAGWHAPRQSSRQPTASLSTKPASTSTQSEP